MNLRSYQAEAVENAFADWAAGKRSTLFVCPTGGGKTVTFAEGDRRALVVADRNSHLVGVISDQEIADRTGMLVNTRSYRSKRSGIPKPPTPKRTR